jgi:predicted MFS family arabinose efflux permease
MSFLILKTFEISDYVWSKTNMTVVIIALCAFQQGIQEMAELSTQYLFKDDFGVSPAMMGIWISIIYIPWY